MTIAETVRHLRGLLAPAVGPDEAGAMAYAIIEDIKGYTKAQVVACGDRELLPETTDRIDKIARRILDGEPMQYATGKAHWRGRIFAVNSSVLIPRPETAQLVDIITDTCSTRNDLRVLDIGTGSGCIAISLALDLPFSEVTAVDISADALAMAKKNAGTLKAIPTDDGSKAHVLPARMNFLQADAFTLSRSLPYEKFDIIVSNPPYVLESERTEMDPRVTEHEPSQALFVSDSAPIAIYEAIARYATDALSPGGRLYFEINPLCANLISNMLAELGFTDIDVVSDYRGAQRFIISSLGS